MTTTNPTPDSLAYGTSGYRCGCGKDAHSNLTPCQVTPAPLSPEREAAIRANRYTDRSPAAADIDIDDLLAELDRARAEHEPYEMLTEQGCEAGKHPTWLVDSEFHHACPWCENARLLAERQETNGKLVELTVALRATEAERNELRKRVVKPNAERMTIKAAAANVIDGHRDAVDLATRITDEITTALNEVRGGVR